MTAIIFKLGNQIKNPNLCQSKSIWDESCVFQPKGLFFTTDYGRGYTNQWHDFGAIHAGEKPPRK